jgi:hypothetical protein
MPCTCCNGSADSTETQAHAPASEVTMVTLITTLPVLFMIVGALLWIYSEKTGKWAELGRIMFAAGAFAICFALGNKTVALIK